MKISAIDQAIAVLEGKKAGIELAIQELKAQQVARLPRERKLRSPFEKNKAEVK